MVGSHHEENDREDSEVIFSWTEQIIYTLTKMVTQLIVMKGKEANTMIESSMVGSPFKTLSQEIAGDFEKHTKVIGSKIMRKMGYDGQGILIPIEAQ
jgi:hypothetical protein